MKYRENGVPKITKKQRKKNLKDINAIKELVASLSLYIGQFEEKQLTTEQKELLYDISDEQFEDLKPGQRKDDKQRRWWRQ